MLGPVGLSLRRSCRFAVAVVAAIAAIAPADAQQQPAPPPAAPAPENPGLVSEIGKLLKDSGSLLKDPGALLPSFTRPDGKPDAPAPDAAPEAPSPAQAPPGAAQPAPAATAAPAPPTALPIVPTVIDGRQVCPASASSAADCAAAATMLCRSKGYQSGRSLGVDATEKCSAKVLIPGRTREPGDCRTENFVTRAWCQ